MALLVGKNRGHKVDGRLDIREKYLALKMKRGPACWVHKEPCLLMKLAGLRAAGAFAFLNLATYTVPVACHADRASVLMDQGYEGKVFCEGKATGEGNFLFDGIHWVVLVDAAANNLTVVDGKVKSVGPVVRLNLVFHVVRTDYTVEQVVFTEEAYSLRLT